MNTLYKSNISSLYEKGLRAYKTNNLDYAIELFNAILEKVADHKDARYYLLLSLVQKYQTIKNRWFYASYMYLKKTLMYPIIIYRRIRKEHIKLINYYNKLVNTYPLNTNNIKEMGRLYEKLELKECACSTYLIITKIDINNLFAYKSLGRLYALLKDPKTARHYYEKALSISSVDLEARKGLQDLAAIGTIEKGWEKSDSYRGKIKDKVTSEVLEKETHLRKDDKDYIKILDTLKNELKKHPNDIQLIKKIADIYYKQGDYDNAYGFYKNLTEINPSGIEAKEYLRKIKAKRIDVQIKKIKSENINDPKIIELNKEKEDAMFEELKQRVTEFPTYLPIKYELGVIYIKKNMYDEAIAQFQNSVRDPKYRLTSLNNIGLCFAKKGLNDLAINQFKRALQELKNWTAQKKEIIYNMALTYEESNEKGKAIEQYKMIYEQDINYKDVSKKIDELKNA